jgi:hypothetical protein
MVLKFNGFNFITLISFQSVWEVKIFTLGNKAGFPLANFVPLSEFFRSRACVFINFKRDKIHEPFATAIKVVRMIPTRSYTAKKVAT